jgi:hypothetical protein
MRRILISLDAGLDLIMAPASVLRAADEFIVDAFICDATWNALDVRYDIPQLADTIGTVGTPADTVRGATEKLALLAATDELHADFVIADDTWADLRFRPELR